MKTQNEIRQTIMRLKPELSKRFFVSKIGLFGSVTRGDFSAQSDVDLVVDFDKPVGIEFVDLADFLEEQLQRRVYLLSLKGIKPTFLNRSKPKSSMSERETALLVLGIITTFQKNNCHIHVEGY